MVSRDSETHEFSFELGPRKCFWKSHLIGILFLTERSTVCTWLAIVIRVYWFNLGSRVSRTKTSICLKIEIVAFKITAAWIEIGTFTSRQNRNRFQSFGLKFLTLSCTHPKKIFNFHDKTVSNSGGWTFVTSKHSRKKLKI